MSIKMMLRGRAKTGQQRTLTNRDVWDAAEALSVLVTHGWQDAGIALCLGRSFRALREGRESIDFARMLLLKEHTNGHAVPMPPQMGPQLTDPAAFQAAWRKLLGTTVEVELFPVPVALVLAAEHERLARPDAAACEACKRPAAPALTAAQLEVLMHAGVLEDDEAAP